MFDAASNASSFGNCTQTKDSMQILVSEEAIVSTVNQAPDSLSITVQNQPIGKWDEIIVRTVQKELLKAVNEDGAHDFGHLHRVCSLAMRFAREEQGNELVAFAAGMLHDIVCLPKNDPNENKSSFLAAVRSHELLLDIHFPGELIPNVCHAIHAHSFSAKVEPKTTEAKCVQDADRMEALGALGIIRTFYCSGIFGSQLMDENDPRGDKRAFDDKKFALDHFVQKLLTLQSTMKTDAGRRTAQSLTGFIEEFRQGLIEDHRRGDSLSGRFKIARVFQDSGRKRLALFCVADPFAEKGRALDIQRYALDHLLREDDAYIGQFLDQLRFELNGYCE